MKKLLLILPVFLFSFFYVSAQKTDTLVKKLDSLHKVEEKPTEKPINDVNKVDYTAQTNITFKTYFILLGTDLVQEVTGPFHASKKTWAEVGGFAIVEGALFAFGDKPIQKSTTTFMINNPGLKNTSQYITDFGAMYEVYTLAVFGAYGIIFKSNKVKTTTLLATQSYLSAGAMESAIKFLTGRVRPNAYTANNENNLIFHGPSSGSLSSAFPSGHTTAAFSAATVFAQEYKDETLIPVIAYAAASLVGVSRITQNAHWATDVVAGACLGYVTGKQVVNNYHRYARLKSGKKEKVSMQFNFQYYDGVFMPGMVCKF
jgi:membrane-associated phospholipid phosphatase